jgi:hypothetical protein
MDCGYIGLPDADSADQCGIREVIKGHDERREPKLELFGSNGHRNWAENRKSGNPCAESNIPDEVVVAPFAT